MSYSADVKRELAEQLPDKICCRAAQAYGMLEFGHAFSGREISLQTEQEAVADLYDKLVSRICGVEKPERTVTKRRSALQVCTVGSAEDRTKILARFGHEPREVSVRLNLANVDCDDCARALLRGAFLSCGTVTDPERDYHLEFCVPYRNLSRDLLALLDEVNIPARAVNRNGAYVVYIKESERIEDTLTYLGAPHAALEMMNVKMVKSIRNETNRRMNCDNANIDKTVAAAQEQVAAVMRIKEYGGLEQLPENLRQLAHLRLDNPDMSLRELGEAMEPPLSRSGVNHRLQRIMELAADLPKKV